VPVENIPLTLWEDFSFSIKFESEGYKGYIGYPKKKDRLDFYRGKAG